MKGVTVERGRYKYTMFRLANEEIQIHVKVGLVRFQCPDYGEDYEEWVMTIQMREKSDGEWLDWKTLESTYEGHYYQRTSQYWRLSDGQENRPSLCSPFGRSHQRPSKCWSPQLWRKLAEHLADIFDFDANEDKWAELSPGNGPADDLAIFSHPVDPEKEAV